MKPIIAGQAGGIAGRSEPAYGWAIACLSLSMLLASLGVSIANVALPTLAQAFSAPFAQVQWVVVAYLLAVTMTIVSVGRVGDIFGRRRVLLAGIVLFTVASLLCGIAPTLPLLIGARVVQGIGAAILTALTVALVRETASKDRIGSAMGLLGTMSAVGTALGPALGGFLIAGFGWRAVFFVMVPLGALNILLALRYLRAPDATPETGRSGFDGVGTLLLGLTLGAYALAVTAGGGRFGTVNLALMLAAFLAGCLFVAAQARVPSPLIRLSAFRNPDLSAGLATNGLVSTVMMATLVVGPFYLSLGLGLNDALVGVVMSVGPVVSALSGVPAGRLVDRFGSPAVVFSGLVAMAAGSVALAVLPALFGIAGYIAAIAILTPGYQLFQAANNTAVMMDIHPEQRGVVSGMLSLSRNLGLITGASVMGAVFALASKATDFAMAQPEAVGAGLRATFAIAAGLIVVALVIAAAARSAAGTANRDQS